MNKKKIIVVAVMTLIAVSYGVLQSSVSSDDLMGKVVSGSRNDITRAELAKSITEGIVGKKADLSDYVSCAPDVKEGDKYENYICFLVTQGIFLPNGDGNFNPRDSVKRAEAAQIFFAAYDFLAAEELVPDLDEDAAVCNGKGKCMYTDVKNEDGISYVVAQITNLKIVDVKPWTTKSKFEPSKALSKTAAKTWVKNFAKLVKKPYEIIESI